MPTRSQVVYAIKRLFVALGFTSFLVFLSIFPSVGYVGEANVNREDIQKFQVPGSLFKYAIVEYTYNLTYNPFIYPLTWLYGRGHIAGVSAMMIYPKAMVQAGPFNVAKWPSTMEIEDDAVMGMVLLEVRSNFLMLLVVVLAIEIAAARSLFFCLLGGIIGFIPGGALGTVAGFLIGACVVGFVAVRSKEQSRIARIWRGFRKEMSERLRATS